jgi:hypothetical protein
VSLHGGHGGGRRAAGGGPGQARQDDCRMMLRNSAQVVAVHVT